MKIITTFWYEIKLDVIRQSRYKFSLIANMWTYFLIYFLLMYSNSSINYASINSIDSTYNNLFVLIGYTFWQLGSYAMTVCSLTISEELFNGMFELKLLANTNIIVLLFARMISGMLISIFAQLIIVIISCFIGLIKISFISKYLLSLLVLVPSLFGMFGLGLIFGGLVIKFKKIGSFMFLIQTVMFMATSIISIPSIIVILFIPYIQGLKITQQLLLNNSVNIAEWIIYFIINLSWIIIGSVIFKILIYHNKKTGNF